MIGSAAGTTLLLLGGYFGLLLLVWTALILGTQRWGERWRLERPDPKESFTQEIMVSICIPARDEAENIGACVRAALETTWPHFEVVVVDDRSSDDTAEQARQAGSGDPRLVVISGAEPPPGWAGKPWACRRAAGEARGQIICFVDADVRLSPDTVSAVVQVMVREDLRLLSLFGSWELLSFWEEVLIPAVGWLIRGAVDLDAANDPGRPEAFANGQFIAVERNTYDAIDGHGCVRDEVLEDVRFAQRMKARGHRLGMRVAPWAFSVRLYRSLREIVDGYTKNLYEGMGRRPSVALGAALFIAVGGLLPWVVFLAGTSARLLLGWGVPQWLWIGLSALVCALQVLFRYRLELRDGRRGWAAPLHIVANLLLCWILLRSMFVMKTEWKGRTFIDGRAGDPSKNADL